MGTGCFSIFAFPFLAGMPMICEFCRIKIFVITASSKNLKPTLKRKRKKDDKIVLLVK